MNVAYKTPEAEQHHIEYAVGGTKITFGDDAKTLNLIKYERDDDVHIIDSIDAEGILVGSSSGLYYVYEIDIPARQYEYLPDGTDDEGKPKFAKVAVPFDMDKCILTLWEWRYKEWR